MKPSESDTTSAPKLKSIIADAKEGDTIDLSGIEFTADDGESYRIRKDKITIKNGDVNNAKFNIESDGVVFENLSNIGKLTISERVGEGDFTIKNCKDVKEFYVNGGGSESIHIAGTSVAKLAVNKSGVRIAVEKGDTATTIAQAFILKNCKVESTDEETSLAKVIVAETVQAVSFVGKAVVEAIVSTVENAIPKIIVEDAIKIKAADDVIKGSIAENNTSYNTSTIGTAAISEEEKKESAAVAEEASVSDAIVSFDEMDVPDAPRTIEMKAIDSDEGIRIEYQLPGTKEDYETTTTTNFPRVVYINDVGQVIWDTVVEVKDEILYPFVKKGNTYKMRICILKETYNESGTKLGHEVYTWNEIDVVANGGKGDVKLKSYPSIIAEKNKTIRFTAPKFLTENEDAISDMSMCVEGFSGQSWNVKNSAGWKWFDKYNIPFAEITKSYNLNDLLNGPEGDTLAFINCFFIYNYKDSTDRDWEYRWYFNDNVVEFD